MTPEQRAALAKYSGNDPYGDASVIPGVTPGAPSSPDTSGLNIVDALDFGVRPGNPGIPSVDQARAQLAQRPGGSVGFQPAANPGQDQAPAAGGNDFPAMPEDPSQHAAWLHKRAQFLIDNPEVQRSGADDNLLRAAQVDSTGRVLGFGPSGTVGGGGPTRVQQSVAERVQLGNSPELDRLRAERTGYQNDVRTHASEYNDAYGQVTDARTGQAQKLFEQARDMYRQGVQQDAEYKAGLQQRTQEITKGQQELASMKVDPDRYVRDKRAVLGIAAALGAFGGAISNQPNHALNYINAAIDRDIDAQKTAISTKRESLSVTQQQYQNYLAQWGNERAAREASRSNMLSAYGAKLDQFAAQEKSVEKQAGIIAARDAFNLAANQAAMDAAQLAAGSTTFQDKRVHAYGGGAGVKVMNGLDYQAKNAQDRAAIAKTYGSGGEDSLHPDERKSLNEARTKIAGLQEFETQAKLLGPALSGTNAVARAAAQAPFLPATQGANEANTILNNMAMSKAKASYGAAQQAAAEGERVLGLLGAGKGANTNTAGSIQTKVGVLRNEATRDIGTAIKGLSPRLQRQLQQEMGLDDKSFLRLREGYGVQDAANDLGAKPKE